MTAYLLDSSALVKLYVQEAGSAWLRTDVASGAHELAVAEVTTVEVASALFRRVRAGSLALADARRGAAQLLVDVSSDFEVVDLDAAVVRRALAVAEQRALRGYDCIQLGTALVTNDLRVGAGLDPIVLVSADADLNAAAALEGLDVEDPNAH